MAVSQLSQLLVVSSRGLVSMKNKGWLYDNKKRGKSFWSLVLLLRPFPLYDSFFDDDDDGDGDKNTRAWCLFAFH